MENDKLPLKWGFSQRRDRQNLGEWQISRSTRSLSVKFYVI